ncbi:GntR family transcriptional regulator [Eggerthella sinensis]|uniref:GntR family transcriptional regulator n=1 Tax=Eggerthella sinensis TaxID=242230 RepID=UPI001D08622E|nr:GntR family transcriptional regulator [Eggerthella sinensis]MCB7038497.1 GntR family transcriptional regulator [Eggerthella sinensis]
MKRFKIDETCRIPIWVQLRNYILHLILSGTYREGDQLPSVRELSAELEINYNTVRKVYNDLMKDGFIATERGRGTFVCNEQKAREAAGADVVEVMADDFIDKCYEMGFSSREIMNVFERKLGDRL